MYQGLLRTEYAWVSLVAQWMKPYDKLLIQVDINI